MFFFVNYVLSQLSAKEFDAHWPFVILESVFKRESLGNIEMAGRSWKFRLKKQGMVFPLKLRNCPTYWRIAPKAYINLKSIWLHSFYTKKNPDFFKLFTS